MGSAKQPVSSLKIGNGSEMGLLFDYRVFFTNEVCSAYMDFLAQQAKANPRASIDDLPEQARAAAIIYAATIYGIYPNKPLFKKEIDSSKELSANFKKAKMWADKNNYARLADAFAGAATSGFSPKEAV